MLERRTLGRTGLEVTSAGLGTGGSSRAGIAAGVDHAATIVARALDAGVNLLDTAEANGTEAVLAAGIARSSVRREDVVISTKVSYRVGRHLRTPAEIEEAVRARLTALETEYVDVLHLHSVSPRDYEQVRDRLLPALERQRANGTIRWLGVSEGFFIDEEHRMLTRAVADDCWDVLMVGFNLLNQTARERVFRRAIASNIGVIGMYAVRDVLHDLDLVSAHLRERAADGTLPPTADVEGVIRTLADALRATGSTLPDLAYRFAAAEAGVSSVLFGTGNPAHLAANLESFGKPPLDVATLEALRGILPGIAALSGELNRPQRRSLPRRIAGRLRAMWR